ncbi:hypothetical protein MTO96_024846 [Rhipicephalus appendiculatus]
MSALLTNGAVGYEQHTHCLGTLVRIVIVCLVGLRASLPNGASAQYIQQQGQRPTVCPNAHIGTGLPTAISRELGSRTKTSVNKRFGVRGSGDNGLQTKHPCRVDGPEEMERLYYVSLPSCGDTR